MALLFQTTFQSAMDSIWKYLQFYIFLVSVNILMCPRQSWIIRRYYKKERTKLGLRLCALLFLIMNILLTEATLIRDILWKTVCGNRNVNVDSLGNLSLAASSQCGKMRNSLSLKFFSSNQLFSNFFSKTIAFTKFLRKKCENYYNFHTVLFLIKNKRKTN